MLSATDALTAERLAAQASFMLQLATQLTKSKEARAGQAAFTAILHKLLHACNDPFARQVVLDDMGRVVLNSHAVHLVTSQAVQEVETWDSLQGGTLKVQTLKSGPLQLFQDWCISGCVENVIVLLVASSLDPSGRRGSQ
jgi:hypothetical protein